MVNLEKDVFGKVFDNGPNQENQKKSKWMDNKKLNNNVKSVKDASRLHSGNCSVPGVISSVSQLYKMVRKVKFVCHRCGTKSSEKFECPIDMAQFNDKVLRSPPKCCGPIEAAPPL